ncbi:MAG: L-serine ammonia-lyase [Gammaproteobacteria bacterium]|nr:L-serine ammonia-lyase [Gammaproteobacteria bacterium]
MPISIFDLFKIGIGPSSSHTVGPMRAARTFIKRLQKLGILNRTASLKSELYGSLGATGKGHGSDKAVLLGLEGEEPDTVDVDSVESRVAGIRENGTLALLGIHSVPFREKDHLILYKRQVLPYHPNGMRFTALASDGTPLQEQVFFSVGGGFIVEEAAADDQIAAATPLPMPYPFTTGKELLSLCNASGLCISTLMLENEKSLSSEETVRAELLEIWKVMRACVDRGCHREGILPGGMKVKRRAAGMYRRLRSEEGNQGVAMAAVDWTNLYALAVNEENAAGGRIVTAPTNGAAGVIPAVLHYYQNFCRGADDDGVIRFLLAAGAIGILYKINASISGAEVGCQGEVGAACSMAAGGLTEALGGTPSQVENAAEIGMEHNLGLTCDPVGGLVQVPCIERNAMGAVKAINASRMAMFGDGTHYISLDKVIRTMRETGRDMKTKYKETARGGLAVNFVDC